MRIVFLEAWAAPRGRGFYEIGPDGVGDGGPYTGEAARVMLVNLLASGGAEGVAVWRHELPALLAAEDEQQVAELIEDAEAAGGPLGGGLAAMDRLVDTVNAACPLPPPHDRPPNPGM